ncbi:hypothetical protein CYMTET_13440 [Cymbomonas tetramitiformis]|uniref:Uncharacterized protein n=1 Tax=Cymbomonas tetramitiformis TaxID=36881 RepID=A0AAE0GIF5_9CHLO|nr:hypothetical protein CYMTET_13440 [Cymbomonas tetramitiformis]
MGKAKGFLETFCSCFLPKEHPVLEDARKGHLEEVKKFIQNDKENFFKIRTRHGETVVHLAAEAGSFPIVEYVLEQRLIAVDDPTKTGQTALHRAAYKGHVELVEFLLKSGAAVNATNRSGQTPLHRAAYKGKLEVVKALLREGADCTAKDDKGRTAVSRAQDKKQEEVVKLLEQHLGNFEKALPVK